MQPGHRLLSVIIGLVAGALSGLMGVGGGIVMIPGMVLAMNFPQHLANGTSLAAIFFTAIAALVEYVQADLVDWNLAFFLAVGSVIGAIFGSILSHKFPSATLRKFFGIFLIGVATWLFFSPSPSDLNASSHLVSEAGILQPFLVLLFGIIAGTIAGFFGVGGGLVLVPMMTILLGVGQRMAQGISLAVIIPTAFSGWLIHNRRGNVNGGVAIYLAGSSMLFAWLVARLAVKMDDHLLRQIFSVIVSITAVNLLLRRERS